MHHRIVKTFVICLLSSNLVQAKETAEGLEFFETRIRPILVQHCYDCHSADAKKLKGGLLLDTQAGTLAGGDSGPAVVPGNPQSSILLHAINYEDYEMPPKGKLPEEMIADFTKWIRMGAPDPRQVDTKPLTRDIDIEAGRQFWAFQPVRAPAIPVISDTDWATTDVDRFVLARLEQAGLSPVGDADKPTWLRRITFDLIGLPPTLAELDAFLADESPAAKSHVVDRLLDSARFGERWGRNWLDVARFAESIGRSRNFPFLFAWRYRDYVIDAFNADKPYDQFIVEQLAGDLLPYTSPAQFAEQHIATGFLAIGSHDLNERDRNVYQMDVIADQIDTTSRAMLALTVGCARCHDHKFDPIPTTDYYALAGIFKSTELLNGYLNKGGGGNYVRGDLLIPLGEKKPGEKKAVKPPTQDELLTAGLKPAQAKKLRQAQNGRKAAEQKVESITNDKRLGAKTRKQRLAAARKVLSNKTKQFNQLRNKLGRQRNVKIEGPACLGVRDRQQIVDCQVNIRGDVKKLGEPVPRGLLRVVGPSATELPSHQSGRLELAHWIASPQNPLTGRVMVNRIWHHLFGRGLVRTVDNFGEMGANPSHPELLDHLADRFVSDGWSIKRVIRQVVLSRTYGLDAAYHAENAAIDGENKFLWRMNSRRLDFESLRDSMLLASDQLDTSRPQGSPVEKMAAAEIGRRQKVSFDHQAFKHRSVYLPVLRSQLPEEMVYFDFPDSSEVRGARSVTTVPTQSLFLLNSQFVIGVSEATATLLLHDEQISDADIARQAHRRILGREATLAEIERIMTYAQERQTQPSAEEQRRYQTKNSKGRDRENPGTSRHAAWAEVVHAMLASAEFRYR